MVWNLTFLRHTWKAVGLCANPLEQTFFGQDLAHCLMSYWLQYDYDHICTLFANESSVTLDKNLWPSGCFYGISLPALLQIK